MPIVISGDCLLCHEVCSGEMLVQDGDSDRHELTKLLFILVLIIQVGCKSDRLALQVH